MCLCLPESEDSCIRNELRNALLRHTPVAAANIGSSTLYIICDFIINFYFIQFYFCRLFSLSLSLLLSLIFVLSLTDTHTHASLSIIIIHSIQAISKCKQSSFGILVTVLDCYCHTKTMAPRRQVDMDFNCDDLFARFKYK